MKSLYYFTVIGVLLWTVSLSGQNLEFTYTSPLPDAIHLNPQQCIILKTEKAFDIHSLEKTDIRIEGQKSGIHRFNHKLSKDHKTLILDPMQDFELGEKVQVQIGEGLKTDDGTSIEGFSFSFQIKPRENLTLLKEFYRREHEKEAPEKMVPNAPLPHKNAGRDNFYPSDYQVPQMVHYNTTDDRNFFFTFNPRAGNSDYSNFLSINDKYGIPLFFRRMENNSLNFHVMPTGLLAYARNDYGNPENEKYFVMDSAFVTIDSICTGNGYNLDGHDIHYLDNGHFLVMSYDPQIIDMSQYVLGGNPNAIVIGLVIQEVDNEENVYFQWRSWDHFQITDATDDINLLASNIDYVHGNALEIDTDGNVLLSSRHLDEITKINFETGEIMYRFGLLARNNQFAISNDPFGFSHQHDVRVLANGNITIFDNGNLHPAPFSQALEYSIDENNMTANRVWYYQEDPNVYGAATGSFRREENGFNLIGWGATWPLAASEVKTDHSKVLEVYLDGSLSYRVLKYPWETNLFTAPDIEDFGNFFGQSEAKTLILPIWNSSDHLIAITSAFNHSDEFMVAEDLPKYIDAGDTVTLTLAFSPEEYGEQSDVLTLNYDRYTLSDAERIARQIQLIGITDSTLPLVAFNPAYGSQNVDPESGVHISFSEPIQRIDGADITNEQIPALFTFKQNHEWGTDVAFYGSISEDKQEIVLHIPGGMEEQQQYFVKLLPDILKGLQDNVISHAEITVFRTGIITQQQESEMATEVLVTPNPFSDRLWFSSIGETISRIKITHISGVQASEEYTDQHTVEIQTRDFSNGLYVIQLTLSNGETKVYKAVKTQ